MGIDKIILKLKKATLCVAGTQRYAYNSVYTYIPYAFYIQYIHILQSIQTLQ